MVVDLVRWLPTYPFTTSLVAACMPDSCCCWSATLHVCCHRLPSFHADCISFATLLWRRRRCPWLQLLIWAIACCSRCSCSAVATAAALLPASRRTLLVSANCWAPPLWLAALAVSLPAAAQSAALLPHLNSVCEQAPSTAQLFAYLLRSRRVKFLCEEKIIQTNKDKNFWNPNPPQKKKLSKLFAYILTLLVTAPA